MPGAPEQLWHCGMHPQVIQDHPGDCPICHMALTPMKGSGGGGGGEMASGVPAEHKVAYWWDPMLGPPSISNHPGKSAMGMEMVPVYADKGGATAGGPQVTVDPRTVQAMGVQTAPVTRGPLHQTIRAVGVFKLPEPGLHDVSLKVGGWIDKLNADQEGMHVQQGEPLFALYSQDLQVAAQELISAVKSRDGLPADAGGTLRKETDDMVASARRKLDLWDVDRREIDAIAKADRPPKDVTFYSPATGHVEEKMVVQGAAVTPGMRLMRVEDHSVMWLDAEVYEQQIPLVRLGQTVDVTLDAVPGRTFTGTITFIYPHVDPMTRTLMVRATFDNPGFTLKPGMYADADVVTQPLGDAVQVPKAAVIDTGTRQVVFLDQGDGHYAPRTVRTGVRGDDDQVQIVDGLTVGETVVTSGQFLMDVESRTQEAIAKLRGGMGATDAATMAAPSTPPMEGMGVMKGMGDTQGMGDTKGMGGMGDMKAMDGNSMGGMSPMAAPMPASRPATTVAGLSEVYCPMAKAVWLQAPGDTDNPYLGPGMKTCGQAQGELPAPPAGSPLAPVVTAYLSVQQSMAEGRVDAGAVAALKAAADRVADDADLRAATGRLAAAGDHEAAREPFEAVTTALVPLLKPAAAPMH